MKPIDIAILLAVALIVGAAVWRLISNKRKKGSICGCGCGGNGKKKAQDCTHDCESCSGCMLSTVLQSGSEEKTGAN